MAGNKGGPPLKLTPAVLRAICDNLEQRAMPITLACEAEGIDRDTLYLHMGKDPEVARQVARARARAAAILTDKALAGGKGSSFATWFLERRYREDYGPVQKIEHTNLDDVSRMNQEQIAAELAAIEERERESKRVKE